MTEKNAAGPATIQAAADPDDEVELLARCDAIAVEAHHGQIDKQGVPYIEHPRRVAARLSDAEAKAMALLHDVLEDCPEWTPLKLLLADVPPTVIEAVVLLTKAQGVEMADYLSEVASSPLALRVKLADIADNCSPERIAGLRAIDPATAERLEAKYASYLAILADADAHADAGTD